ncbi:programmed cell death protein 2-like [Uloborus diversus]|uniref:programmed cell death protein 2-like n=1 Tax=Uloborus diversus TaxID=327109 RepID=UPI0024099F5D|nr:programmed cell death protein 2-like [Uloborus diversus]
MAESSVELGFVEKRASWKLKSKFFPSKVGGFPSWLRLNPLPNHEDLICKACKKHFVFLMQVYAPILENEHSFHRTIYIFMCPNAKCNKKFSHDNFVIFRSQLPRKNEFYSFEPPEEIEKLSSSPSAEDYQDICEICGCFASLRCDKCSNKKYCSEDHKKNDWEWNHKDVCENDEKDIGKKRQKKLKNYFLLPEFELVTEIEQLPPEAPEKSDEEKMKEYRQFMQSAKAPKDLQDTQLDDLDSLMKKHDKTFNKFQKRIKLEPEQVLRYQRKGVPLWVSSENIPSNSDIPPCCCGAKRDFEFQVMPQLLNYLSLDQVEESIDWGTLLIYTCSKSCQYGTDGYCKEFLWKQDFSDSKE